jgi:phosphatidylglycerophosphate synthase
VSVFIDELIMPQPSSPSRSPAPPVAGHVVGSSRLSIFGVPSETRLRRQLVRAGADFASRQAARAVLLRADWVYDDALVRGLVAAGKDVALVAPGDECVAVSLSASRVDEAASALRAGQSPSAVPSLRPAEVADAYDRALRKREPPYLMPLDDARLPEIERRIFRGAYKGVTDLVTLYAWPKPALAVTRFCARAGITPNQVTSASLLLVLLAMSLFWTGRFALGLLAAWPMTFLDTVDGKLARVTLRSSRFGDVFDHSIDLLHPPFWWWAWIVGLSAAGMPLANAPVVLAVIVAGYVLQRVEEGLFIVFFGMDMHVWRSFDSRFRLITARRNPNLLLLTISVLAGRPDLGIVSVAVWTGACLLVHTVRLAQAAMLRRRGPLRSWLAT